MKRYINVDVLGVTMEQTDEIILFAYGSRGGLRACVALDLANAAKLRDELAKAIEGFAS